MSEKYGKRYYSDVNEMEDTVSKMQQQYWSTKQAVFKKFGKKEDDCVTASDSYLDSKLELFFSIQASCRKFLKLVEAYQDRICNSSQSENSFGKFLKDQGKQDKTRAGKMMSATGKTMCFNAQQRIVLRSVLTRLYQEIETFHCRAIADTLETVQKMEKSRTAYRGALMWMKDASKQLDPDAFGQMEKFRKVQGHVRRTKLRFDKLKLDTLQKVDLLAVSRCNMFSLALSHYQNQLLTFWEKTARCMGSVASHYQGYQPYEFSVLKELADTSQSLVKQTSTPESIPDDQRDIYETLFFDSEYHDELEEASKKENSPSHNPSASKEKKDAEENIGSSNDKTEDIVNTDEDLLCDLNTSVDNFFNLDLNSDLKQVLSTTGSEASFSQQWTAHFGDAPTSPVKVNQGQSDEPCHFLPSQLLDFSQSSLEPSSFDSKNDSTLPTKPIPSPVNQSKDSFKLNDWVKIFAELDPLTNPDAIGSKNADQNDRNC